MPVARNPRRRSLVTVVNVCALLDKLENRTMWTNHGRRTYNRLLGTSGCYVHCSKQATKRNFQAWDFVFFVGMSSRYFLFFIFQIGVSFWGGMPRVKKTPHISGKG